MNRFVGLFVAAILLAAPLSAVASKKYSDKDGQRIEFGSFAGSDLWGSKGPEIMAHGVLYMPEGAKASEPVPLAILISGIGGQRGRDNRMCDVLSRNGIACFGVRTYASRGVGHKEKTSKKLAQAGAGARLHDAYGALEFLARRPEIDRNRVWHIGFSLGGFNSTMAIDPEITKPFQRSDLDFAGFINLYGFCALTSSASLKKTTYVAFAGSADGNYHESECNDFISSIKERGVNASIVVFEGGQFNPIGHMWDYMKSATSDWFGNPEGPWKFVDKSNHSSKGLGLYDCEFEVDPTTRTISTRNGTITNPSDNEGWDFALNACPKRKSIRTSNGKVTAEVDEAIMDVILGR